MRKRSGLKVGMVCALVVSGVAAMPAPSWATTTLSTTVASTSSTGPNSANTEVTSVANCSSKLVSGGGARVVVTSGTMPNGLKLDGTVPSTNGTGQSANGDTSPTYWIGAGGAGGATGGAGGAVGGTGGSNGRDGSEFWSDMSAIKLHLDISLAKSLDVHNVTVYR